MGQRQPLGNHPELTLKATGSVFMKGVALSVSIRDAESVPTKGVALSVSSRFHYARTRKPSHSQACSAPTRAEPRRGSAPVGALEVKTVAGGHVVFAAQPPDGVE